jgi:hypothetical protein
MSWVMDRLGELHSAADVEDRDTAEMAATKLTGEDLEQVQRGSLSFLFIRAKRALEWGSLGPLEPLLRHFARRRNPPGLKDREYFSIPGSGTNSPWRLRICLTASNGPGPNDGHTGRPFTTVSVTTT